MDFKDMYIAAVLRTVQWRIWVFKKNKPNNVKPIIIYYELFCFYFVVVCFQRRPIKPVRQFRRKLIQPAKKFPSRRNSSREDPHSAGHTVLEVILSLWPSFRDDPFNFEVSEKILIKTAIQFQR